MARLVPASGLISQAFGGTTPGQAAVITDNGTGSSAVTAVAAGVGVETLCFPVTLPVGGTTAIDIVTAFTPGYKFKILKWAYVEDVVATGASGSRVYNMEIVTADVGTVTSTVTVTTDGAAKGRVIAGTTVTGANTGTASGTISIEVASGGTSHDAGAGSFVVTIQNMDVADAWASLLAKLKSSGYMATS